MAVLPERPGDADRAAACGRWLPAEQRCVAALVGGGDLRRGRRGAVNRAGGRRGACLVACGVDNGELQCTTGSLDLGAGGTLEPPSKLTLDVAGDASRCMLGEFAELDGRTLSGKIVLDGKKPPLIDLGVTITKLAFGDLDNPTAGGAAFKATNLSARIGNLCAQCGNGKALEIAVSGGIELAALTPGVPPGFIRIGLTIGFRLLVEGNTTRAISLRVTNLSLYGASSSLTVILEGELLRTLEAALGLPPGTLTLIPDDPAPVFDEDAAVPRGRVVAVSTTLGRCLAGDRCSPRVAVTVRTTGRGPVAVQLQRRACSTRACRWRTLARSTLVPNATYVARAKASRRLPAGTYRIVASPSGRKGTTVRRTFRVLAA